MSPSKFRTQGKKIKIHNNNNNNNKVLKNKIKTQQEPKNCNTKGISIELKCNVMSMGNLPQKRTIQREFVYLFMYLFM